MGRDADRSWCLLQTSVKLFGRCTWIHGLSGHILVYCSRCPRSHGLRPKKLYTGVQVTPAPVQISIQQPLVLSFKSVVRLVKNFSPCLRTAVKHSIILHRGVLEVLSELALHRNLIDYGKQKYKKTRIKIDYFWFRSVCFSFRLHAIKQIQIIICISIVIKHFIT